MTAGSCVSRSPVVTIKATRTDKLGKMTHSPDSDDDDTDEQPTRKTNKEVKPASNFSKMKKLPDNFQPSQYDVLCGRGKNCTAWRGNLYLRKLVNDKVGIYALASSKLDKGRILSMVINEVKAKCKIGGFVKKDNNTGHWYEVGDFLAREKISQCFRDALHEHYSSSAQSKNKRRREIQAQRHASLPADDQNSSRGDFGGSGQNQKPTRPQILNTIHRFDGNVVAFPRPGFGPARIVFPPGPISTVGPHGSGGMGGQGGMTAQAPLGVAGIGGPHGTSGLVPLGPAGYPVGFPFSVGHPYHPSPERPYALHNLPMNQQFFASPAFQRPPNSAPHFRASTSPPLPRQIVPASVAPGVSKSEAGIPAKSSPGAVTASLNCPQVTSEETQDLVSPQSLGKPNKATTTQSKTGSKTCDTTSTGIISSPSKRNSIEPTMLEANTALRFIRKPRSSSETSDTDSKSHPTKRKSQGSFPSESKSQSKRQKLDEDSSNEALEDKRQCTLMIANSSTKKAAPVNTLRSATETKRPSDSDSEHSTVLENSTSDPCNSTHYTCSDKTELVEVSLNAAWSRQKQKQLLELTATGPQAVADRASPESFYVPKAQRDKFSIDASRSGENNPTSKSSSVSTRHSAAAPVSAVKASKSGGTTTTSPKTSFNQGRSSRVIWEMSPSSNATSSLFRSSSRTKKIRLMSGAALPELRSPPSVEQAIAILKAASLQPRSSKRIEEMIAVLEDASSEPRPSKALEKIHSILETASSEPDLSIILEEIKPGLVAYSDLLQLSPHESRTSLQVAFIEQRPSTPIAKRPLKTVKDTNTMLATPLSERTPSTSRDDLSAASTALTSLTTGLEKIAASESVSTEARQSIVIEERKEGFRAVLPGQKSVATTRKRIAETNIPSRSLPQKKGDQDGKLVSKLGFKSLKDPSCKVGLSSLEEKGKAIYVKAPNQSGSAVDVVTTMRESGTSISNKKSQLSNSSEPHTISHFDYAVENGHDFPNGRSSCSPSIVQREDKNVVGNAPDMGMGTVGAPVHAEDLAPVKRVAETDVAHVLSQLADLAASPEPKDHITVCAIQPMLRHPSEDPINATRRVLSAIEQAMKKETVDLFVLPELSPVGHSEDTFEKYLPNTGENRALYRRIDALISEKARDLHVYVCYGTIGYEGSNDGFGFTIRQKVVNRYGDLVAQYDKIVLSDHGECAETSVLKAGPRKPTSFTVDSFRLGILLGEDILVPQLASDLAKKEHIDVILHPASFSREFSFRAVKSFRETRAMENAVFLLGVNYAGEKYGGTTFVPPWVDSLHESSSLDTGIGYQMCKIEHGLIQSARAKMPI